MIYSDGCYQYTWEFNGRWEPNGGWVIAYGTLTIRFTCACSGDCGPWIYTDIFRTAALEPEATAASCPANSALRSLPESGCECLPAYEPDIAGTQCLRVNPVLRVNDPLPSCDRDPPKGNPIYPLRGIKEESVDTGLAVGGERLVLTYDSTSQAPRILEGPRFTSGTSGASSVSVDATLVGHGWSGSLLDRRLSLATVSAGGSGTCANPSAAQATRGNSRSLTFSQTTGGPLSADAATTERLQAVAGGYVLRSANERAHETYNTTGQLLGIDRADGTKLTLIYSDASTPTTIAPAPGYLIEASDNFGRSLKFSYKAPMSGSLTGHLLGTVTDAAEQVLTLGHDSSNRLTSLTWADGKVRTFVYESSAYPRALTGILDENGARHSTYGYDAQGRATSTERAGGVNRASVSYSSAPYVRVTEQFDAACNAVFRYFDWAGPQGTTVTSSTGAVSTWNSTMVLNRTALTEQSQPAGSGCAASTSSQAYDANGNVSSRDDFNGTRVCYASEPGRNLETTRVEGLAGGAVCSSVTSAGAALPTGARKVSTQWHPDWKLATKVAEPGRITASVYNGLPDPFNGNTIASCAPGTALLPDGKPIVVLCKKVEQATTDADGSQGFSATLQAGPANRVEQWTYNQYGQMLTHDGPRTDVSDVTTYAYYASTTANYTLGDLQSVTNAAGKVTQYTKYNKHGQVLEMIDPNGVVTTNTYDLRQRLLSTSVGGQTTSHEYWPTGLLKKTTAPDSSFMSYEYDTAQRLRAVVNNLGHRIEYTLDNAGNRTAEVVRDPGGVLRRQLSRSIDALGRVQQLVGRE